MTRWIVAGLVALNVMLGVGVYMRFAERPAQAQIGAPKGDYAVVAGSNNNQAIIYIMDAATGNLVAIRADPINHSVQLAAKARVALDLK